MKLSVQVTYLPRTTQINATHFEDELRVDGGPNDVLDHHEGLYGQVVVAFVEVLKEDVVEHR